MDPKTKTKDHFNDQAILYDSNNKYKFPRFHYKTLLEEIIKQYLSNNFLDIGCGTGVILENIANNNAAALCYGIGLSENMIEQARKRLKDKANLIAGDVENLPYENSIFDYICCSSSFLKRRPQNF
jgi:ubiquinone/menaquinone biosynthesis C-methylase UbiE